MKQTEKTYVAPAILEELTLETEACILASSSVVNDDTEVVSTGQEYESVDMSGFNHDWK